MTTNQQPLSIELNHWGILAVTGKDAKTFLQGQITVSMDDINPNQAKLSGYCNLKGRLHGMFYVIFNPSYDGYWLVMPQSIIRHIQSTLKKYAMFSKVTFEVLSNLNILGFIQVDTHTLFDFKPDRLLQSACLNDKSILMSLPNRRTLALVQNENLESIKNKLPAMPISDINPWDNADIESGIPLIKAESIESFLPHYINLDKTGSLNFAKGCYLGQEIIARMEYKGNIKRHLYQATYLGDTIAPAGTEILSENGSVAGSILYSAQCAQKHQCLISMQDSFIDAELKLNYGNKITITAVEPAHQFA